jgi:hypothetical protein
MRTLVCVLALSGVVSIAHAGQRADTQQTDQKKTDRGGPVRQPSLPPGAVPVPPGQMPSRRALPTPQQTPIPGPGATPIPVPEGLRREIPVPPNTVREIPLSELPKDLVPASSSAPAVPPVSSPAPLQEQTSRSIWYAAAAVLAIGVGLFVWTRRRRATG